MFWFLLQHKVAWLDLDAEYVFNRIDPRCRLLL